MLRFLALLLALVGAASAQDVPTRLFGRFKPDDGKQAVLSVSTTSSRVGLPASPVVFVYNGGKERAWIAFGDATVTAPGNELLLSVGPGCGRAMLEGDATHLAAVAQSGSTNLILLGGHGLSGLHPNLFTPGSSISRPNEQGCPPQ